MRFEHVGFAPELVDYEAAWAHQREVHAAVVEGAEDTVLLLEHAAVYTAGKRTEPHQRPFDGTPVIDVCADLGLATDRVDGRSGVWTPDGARKVAAIGIRVARGVTMHGFALNCDPDLRAYDRIVPCGIADATVTSLSRELGRDVPVEELLPLLEARLPALSATVPAA